MQQLLHVGSTRVKCNNTASIADEIDPVFLEIGVVKMVSTSMVAGILSDADIIVTTQENNNLMLVTDKFNPMLITNKIDPNLM